MRGGSRAISALGQIAILGVAAWAGFQRQVPIANSLGIAGYSGELGSALTCNAFHGGAVAPDVSFEGPTQVEAGSTTPYRFVVKSNGAQQDKAGFNVAVGEGVTEVFAGEFTPGNGAHNAGPGFRQCPTEMHSCELTHDAPQIVDVNHAAAWDFTWRAPAEAGMYVFYGAGNSVNQDALGTTGDRSTDTTFTVEVVAGPPTEVPTATEMPTETFPPRGDFIILAGFNQF